MAEEKSTLRKQIEELNRCLGRAGHANLKALQQKTTTVIEAITCIDRPSGEKVKIKPGSTALLTGEVQRGSGTPEQPTHLIFVKIMHGDKTLFVDAEKLQRTDEPASRNTETNREPKYINRSKKDVVASAARA